MCGQEFSLEAENKEFWKPFKQNAWVFTLRGSWDPIGIAALTMGLEQKEGSSEIGQEVGSAIFGTATL